MDRQLHEQIEQVGKKITASSSTTLSDEKSQVSNIQQQFSFLNINTVEYAVPVELQFVDYLGGGNYGNVIKVRTPDGIELAVKKMYEPFSHEVKARRVYRELKLLQLINHGNIIRFVNMYTPDRELRSFKNVYIVSVYAGVSLKQVLDRQKQLGIRMINFDHVKYLIYQLLRALKYLHSANVIHRDLKPSNLAITEECDLTVLDFGLARTVPNNADNLTAYVISRWYRSPEVIYWNNVSYNAKADVWSVGCILAELLTQKVLFPGSEAMEQYKLIIRLCGSPDEELMNKIEQQNSPAMRMVIERMSGKCERRDFRRVFAQYPMDAVDLLDKLLVLDPDRRISVEEALQHAYMRDYHLPEDEPIAEQPFNIEDNDTTKTLNDWKEIVWQELQMHYQEVQHLQQQQKNFPLSALDSSNSSTSEQMVTQQASQPEHLSSIAAADFSASSAAISPLSSSACHSQQHTFAASASLITPVIASATSVTTAINNNCTAFSAASSATSNNSIKTIPTVFGPAALTVPVSNASFSASPNSSQTTFVPVATATTSANIFSPATSSINANVIVVNGKEHAVAVSPTSAPTPSSLSPSTFRQCSSI